MSRTAVRPLPQESAGPRLRLVPAQRPNRWRSVLAIGALSFFVVLAGAVAIQAQRIGQQDRLDDLDARTAEVRDVQRELRVQVAEAESPERILAAARNLGMVEPGQIVAVPAGPAVPVVPSTGDGSGAAG